MKSGVLYQSGVESSGQLSVAGLILKLKAIAWSLRKVGGLMILMGFAGLIWVYYPLAVAEVHYKISNIQFSMFNLVTKSKFSKDILADKTTWTVPDQNYSLYIPKIQAIAKVIPDVSLNSQGQYLTALKSGVAAAAGLAHPGQIGTIYLFAHSTDGPWNFARYNAVFYLLDRVESGDRVEVMYNNRLYKYRVAKVQVLASTDTRYLIPQTNEELLVLQTCYPPGTSWKRLVVEARPAY